MKKRVFAAILALFMIIGLVPSYAVAAQTASATTPQSAMSLLDSMKAQSTEKPKGFDEDTKSPYGTAVGQPFTLQEHSELLTYVTSNIDYDSKIKSFTYENYIDGALKTDSRSGYGQTGQLMSENGNILSYTQAVAFDPMGSGYRNYVAFVGYNYTTNCAEVWFSSPMYPLFQQTGTGAGVLLAKDTTTYEPLKVTLYKCDWIKKMFDSNNFGLDTADSKNFFQITAGDYDHDGKDSLIVYCGYGGDVTYNTECGTASGLTEIILSADEQRQNYYVTSRAASLIGQLHPAYKRYYSNSNNPEDRLGVALETGDVNGDGIDDLAILSYQNDAALNNAADMPYYKTYSPYLIVAYGEANRPNDPPAVDSTKGVYINKANGSNGYKTMAAPGVSIGDIDGDGFNEIVTAGFLNVTKSNDAIILQNGSIAFAYFNCDKGGAPVIAGSMVETSDCSAISRGDSLRSAEHIWQQFSVECVAFDGLHSKEYMFLNGYIYKLNDSGELVRADSLPYLQSAWYGDDKDGKRVKENFIYSTAVGSFLNDAEGRESIVMTIGYKYHNMNKYTYRKVWIHFGDAKGTFRMEGNAGSEYVPITEHHDNAWHDRLNCLVVALDYDADSVIARYNGKKFAYTDPNVVAVLQAAPYFGEFDPGNSSTTYGYSESYAVSEGQGQEISASIGVAAEIEAGPIKESLEAGYSTEMIHEYMKSRETTYTTTFEANGENQVILRRTLFYIYDYDVATFYSYVVNFNTGEVKYLHNWEKSALVITVPQYPVMSQLSIEQYDEFATAYNQQFGKTSVTEDEKKKGQSPYMMDIIGDKAEKYYLSENEGNPFAYAEFYTDYANGMELSKSSWIELSHSGGTSQLGYDTTLTEEQSQTKSDGGYFNMTIMAGGGVPGFEVYGGVSASFEALNSSTVSTAKITSTNTGGTVQNLDKENSDYHFNWRLIGWKTEGEFFDDVLFVGYAVNGQSAPLRPVDDLYAVYSIPTGSAGETATLHWTAPEPETGRGTAVGFDIYRVLPGGEYEKLGTMTSQGAGVAHSYAVDVSGYEENCATFAVVALSGNVDIGHSDFSNEAMCLLSASYKEASAMIEASREQLQQSIDVLEEQLESGQSDAIAGAVEELTKAYQKADSELSAAMQSQIDGLGENLSDLSDALSEAREALQKSIDTVQENLDKAKQNLEAAMEANTEDFNTRLAQLTEAMNLADSVINSTLAEQALKNEAYDGLFQTVNETIAALEEACKKSDAQLNDKIDAGAADFQTKLDALKAAMELADSLINGTLADQELKNAAYDEMIAASNNLIAALDEAYRKADAGLKAQLKALKDEVSALRDEKNADLAALQAEMKEQMDALREEKDAQLESLRSEKDEQLEALRKEKDAQLEALREELRALQDRVTENKTESDESVAQLTSTDGKQEEDLGTLQVVSYVGLGIAGVSMISNGGLLIQKLLRKRTQV